MASINTSINGVTVSVTKQADGTITWSADSVPGASYGPSGSGLVPGHAGGVLDAATINDWTNTTISSRQAAINYVNDAQAQINDTTRNPPYDPAYIASLKSQIASSEANIQQLTDSISLSQSLSTQINSLTQQVNSAATEPPAEAQTNAEKNAADAQTASPDSTSTTSTPVPTTTGTEDPTNPSTTDQDTADKYATASPVVGPPQIQVFDDGSTLTTDASGNVTSTESTDSPQANRLAGLPPGATAPGTLTALSRSIGVESGGQLGGASATWSGAKDMRTIITVPKTYLVGPASVLAGLGGILFPYTPNISYDNQANYSSLNPTHSNFPIYFYQKSSMGPITISGKFSNQNEKDGAIYLGIVHLLRALTKMRWGTDKDAGSPPPVCRLNAWGDSMLSNVPVSLASFKIELPEGVDYVAVGTSPQYQGLFGNTMVPTISTINLTLNIMYSRQEMQNYGVDAWLNNTLRGKGYL